MADDAMLGIRIQFAEIMVALALLRLTKMVQKSVTGAHVKVNTMCEQSVR